MGRFEGRLVVDDRQSLLASLPHHGETSHRTVIRRVTLSDNVTLQTGCENSFIAGSLEAAYSLNWGAQEIWGKGGGETLALL